MELWKIKIVCEIKYIIGLGWLFKSKEYKMVGKLK